MSMQALGQRQFHDQLAMFHTAEELKTQFHPNDLGAEPADELWDGKTHQVNRAQPHDWGYVPDADKGIHTPVDVRHQRGDQPRLMDGHHRVAAAYAHNPRALVPVRHSNA